MPPAHQKLAASQDALPRLRRDGSRFSQSRQFKRLDR